MQPEPTTITINLPASITDVKKRHAVIAVEEIWPYSNVEVVEAHVVGVTVEYPPEFHTLVAEATKQTMEQLQEALFE